MSTSSLHDQTALVGPVLHAGAVGDAIVAAIRAENANVTLIDRGSYLRVAAPDRCSVTRAAIEESLGRPFRLPGDLEQAMTSFVGHLEVDEEHAQWISLRRLTKEVL